MANAFISSHETIPDGVPALPPLEELINRAIRHTHLVIDVLVHDFDGIARELNCESESDAETLVYYAYHLDKILSGYEHGTRWIREVFDESNNRWIDFLTTCEDRLIAIREQFQELFRKAAAKPGTTSAADLFRAVLRAPVLTDAERELVCDSIKTMIHGPALDLARLSSATFLELRDAFSSQFGETRAPTGHLQDVSAPIT